MTRPLVSICCLTYNHASFIRQCLDGFIMQKTNFSIEVIIHDDASTDGTADIIREYEQKHPNLFKPIYQKENQYSKGVDITPPIFSKLQGKYIAWCEGDDYWTDPYKLQKQVDFLEANEDFSICFHEVKILKGNELVDDYITRKVQDVTDIYELAKGNFMHTPSVVYRKNEQVFKDFAELGKLPVGDYPLHMLNTQYGKIKKLPDVMAVYRVGVGIWSSASGESNYLNWIKVLDKLLNHFSKDENIVYILKQQYAQSAYVLYNIYKNENNIEDERYYFTQACLYSPELIYANLSILEKELNSIKKSKAYYFCKIISKLFVALKNILL